MVVARDLKLLRYGQVFLLCVLDSAHGQLIVCRDNCIEDDPGIPQVFQCETSSGDVSRSRDEMPLVYEDPMLLAGILKSTELSSAAVAEGPIQEDRGPGSSAEDKLCYGEGGFAVIAKNGIYIGSL